MKKRLLFSCAGALLALAGTASAQEFPTLQDYEVGINGGGTFFGQQSNGQKLSYDPSWNVGLNVTENFANYLGVEQTLFYSQNPFIFHDTVSGTLTSIKLTERMIQFQNSLLIYTRPRQSAIRPFFAAGVGLESFRPDSDAINAVSSPQNAPLYAQGLRSDTRLMFNYGGGIKFRVSNHIGFRVDARGLVGRLPHYGLAPFGLPPAIYVPPNGYINGAQITGGIYLSFGRTIVEPHVEAAPGFAGVSIQAGQTAVCAGTPVNFTSTVDAVAPNHTPTYRWTVDGANAGTNAPQFTYTPTGGGSHSVSLTVVDNITPLFKQAAAVTVTVTEHTAPTITANADKTSLAFGDKAMLYPHPLAGGCPGNLSVAWTASEGTVTGTDPATYDSSSVQIDAGGTKQITATATVTDDKGGSASAPVSLVISKPLGYVRFKDDIIFPTSNARVNNFGKRILIDEVYPALTSGQYSNYDVVLVGHQGNEPPPMTKARKGRKKVAPAPVDFATERASNSAAILSSGDGICPKPGIDLSRIKIATVGPGQGAEFNKPSGAGSVRERKASMIKESDDQLKDQRVEIWFVPKGSNLPPSAANAQQAPDSIKGLGCPK